MLAIAPLGAGAADLVVWWDGGHHAQEDDGLREILAAFEQEPRWGRRRSGFGVRNFQLAREAILAVQSNGKRLP